LLLPEADTIQLLNPISPELSEMRVSLWPGLIQSLIHNTNRQQTHLQLFEGGVVFAGTAEESKESLHIAGLIYGDGKQMNWLEKGHAFDFFDAKAHVEHLLSKHGYSDIEFVKNSHPALHPGQTAEVKVQGISCGFLGALHPKLQSHFDFLSVPILWEINLSVLPELERKRYTGLSKFPQTRRDISFLINKNIEASQIVECIRQAVSSDVLKHVEIFDVYHGHELTEDMVSIAVACIFQDFYKTLVEQDILSYQSAILKVLTEKFSIKLRDGQ
jgi:phenylalanyl-tRNA synthetase beta chain